MGGTVLAGRPAGAVEVYRLAAGTVVTTYGEVTIRNGRGRPDGKALPGWKWRIEKVLRDKDGQRVLGYEVAAAAAPKLYKAVLWVKEIARILEEPS